MKIKIKTRLNQLNVLNRLWSMHELNYVAHTKELRVIKNMEQRLEKILLKKAIEKKGTPLHKDFNITLEYFEAYYLEMIAEVGSQKFDLYSYEHNTLKNLAYQINQKLA